MTHKRTSGNLPSQSLRPIRLTTGDLPAEQAQAPEETRQENVPLVHFSIPIKHKLPSKPQHQPVDTIDMLDTTPHLAQKGDDISVLPTTKHPLTPMPLVPETPFPLIPFIPETPLPQSNPQYLPTTPYDTRAPSGPNTRIDRPSFSGIQAPNQPFIYARQAASSSVQPTKRAGGRVALAVLLGLCVVASTFPLPFIYHLLVDQPTSRDTTLFAWTLALLGGLVLFAGVLLGIIRSLIVSFRRPATT